MLRNIVERKPIEIVERFIDFQDNDTWGYRFDADANGNVILQNDCQRQNYEHALAHPEMFPRVFNKFTVIRRTVMENAHGTCVCGEEVELYDQYRGACECPKCGRWYNIFGQSLLPPEQWADADDDYDYDYVPECEYDDL